MRYTPKQFFLSDLKSYIDIHYIYDKKNQCFMKYLLLLTSVLVIISCKPKLTPNTDANIPMEVNSLQLTDMIASKADIVLLDVRTPEEIAAGKINGALEIDYFNDNFATNIDKLDKNKHYLVYCKSGGRSAKSIALMKEKGFDKCTNLEGGYTAWSSSFKK